MPSFRVAEWVSLLVHLDREQQTKFGIPIFVERFPGFLAAAQLAGPAADWETKKTWDTLTRLFEKTESEMLTKMVNWRKRCWERR